MQKKVQKEILVIEIFDFSKTFIDGEISAYLLLRTLSLCEYVCLVVNRNFTRIMFLFRSIKQITLATSFVCKRHRPWKTFKRCELCELSKFKAQRKLKLFQANWIQFVRLLKLCEIFVRKIYCNKRNCASEKNLSLALTSLMEKLIVTNFALSFYLLSNCLTIFMSKPGKWQKLFVYTNYWNWQFLVWL